MTKTPGRCPNIKNCDLAVRRRTVQIPLKQPFVCPSCGSGLVPPPISTGPDLRLIARLGGGVVVVIGALTLWLASGKPPPPAVPPPMAPKPAVPPPAAPPPISENGSSGPAGPTTVTISPQLLAAAGIIPKGQAAAPVTPTAAPAKEAPPPPKPRREHRVVATARLSAKSPVHPDMQPLDHSHPEYPERDEDTDKTAVVTVTCIVQANGYATGCKLIHQEGGDEFAAAVLHWLAEDTTRFPPFLRHGHPAAQPFTWTIEFFP